MSEAAKSNPHKGVGKMPMPDDPDFDELANGGEGKASPSPKAKVTPNIIKPGGDKIDPDQPDDGLDDGTEPDPEDDKKDADASKAPARTRAPNSIETLAGLGIAGAKLAGKGGGKALKLGAKPVADRISKKQADMRVAKLNSLADRTANFKRMVSDHKAKFGTLAEAADAQFNAPKMKAKYPSAQERKQKAMALAAMEYVGPKGDPKGIVSEFNKSFGELKSDMGECITLTQDIARRPQKYENMGPDDIPKVDEIMTNAWDALNEAKSVKALSPGEDETLDKSFKEQMEKLQEQLQDFLDKIRDAITRVLGR
ncbi:hypothetical protein [Sulfitobacter sp. R18_1]|uniref:hypothetical protein n=1 Tax=Sulfitobacter sp. R18_1 TaxID=2821104 RepID=UPI001AD9A74E|nr:hypothetical protein [Sulfitobacter sp. R18_1]MBO9428496.1 hypothetical protein [Sulfitobacter sp. R18_1]